MAAENAILDFIEAAARSPRIGTTHIGLYSVLLAYGLSVNNEQPLLVSKEKLMATAKIGSANTYFKVLTDLSEAGCIRYCPSFSPKGESRIHLSLFDQPRVLLLHGNRNDRSDPT